MQLTPPSCQTYIIHVSGVTWWSNLEPEKVVEFANDASGENFHLASDSLWRHLGAKLADKIHLGGEIVAVFEFSFLWFVICLAFAAILSAQLFLCFSSHLVFYLIALALSWWSCNLTPPQLSPNSLQLLVPLCDCVPAQNDLVKPSLLCSQLCDTSALCKITLSDQDVTKTLTARRIMIMVMLLLCS